MKKLFTTLLIVCSVTLCKAQWATIPDANFVVWLQTNFATCMSGNQMDTTCSLIVNEDTLQINANPIINLNGIQYFDSLKWLETGYTHIDSISALPPGLIYLDVGNSFGQLVFLPSLPIGLKFLHCGPNLLTSLPSLPNGLEDLYCLTNQISSLPSLPNGLKRLWCGGNLLTNLPILPDSLIELDCGDNQLTTLPALPSKLTWLQCPNNQLTSLPPLPNTLTRLHCGSNQLTSLPALPDSLNILWIMNNPSLVCLPELKKIDNLAFFWTGVQCLPDYGEIITSDPPINTFPLCEVLNPQSCPIHWNIKGTIYSDSSNNCSYENGEPLIFPAKVKLFQSGTLIQQVYSEGVYSFNTNYSTYNVLLDTTDFPFTVNCPPGPDSTVIISLTDSLKQIDFGLDCKPGFDNGVWNIINWSNFFPGNTTPVYIIAGDVVQSLYNVNCSSGVSGEIKVIINGPSNYFSPITGALIPTVIGDTLVYSIADFSLINSDSAFAIYVSTDSTAQIGDQICFEVFVTPLLGDNNLSNNTLTNCFEVSNSFDPNEKEVSPIGNLGYPFTDWLTYTIHFQNTGTSSSQYIQIFDTLDSDLDASTFQLLSYSYIPMVQLFGSKVIFNFVNINLEDSSTDVEASKGYVSYRVKPLANLPLGTSIENTANIYFDFNAPVVTNTVHNQICFLIPNTNISETICAGDSYNFNGTNIFTAGNYSATHSAINGCDSVVNLNLTVETINTTIEQSNDTLTAVSTGTIQWFDCNTQQIIAGATQNIFVPTLTGNYAAIITEGNCSDTSACILVNGFGLVVSSSGFSVFPNPADENITVTLDHPDSYRDDNCRIEITNTLGQIVYQKTMNLKSEICNLQSLSQGVYFITLRSDKFTAVKKIVKQ